MEASGGLMPISVPDFDYVRTLALDNAAIVLEADKQYLVETRLTPLAEKEGYGSLEALIRALRGAPRSGELHNRGRPDHQRDAVFSRPPSFRSPEEASAAAP
jgi:CheR methyltransferase-like protein